MVESGNINSASTRLEMKRDSMCVVVTEMMKGC